MIKLSQSSLIITIDGTKYIEDYQFSPYDKIVDAQIWVSHGSVEAANVLIEDFKIQIPASLCCAYSGWIDWAPFMVGYEFEYAGKYNDHAYYQRSDGVTLYIYYMLARGGTYTVDVDFDEDSGYTWADAGVVKDEFDSIYGAEWVGGMILSAAICGINADPNPVQIGNNIPLIYVTLFFGALSLLLTIYNCHGLMVKKKNPIIYFIKYHLSLCDINVYSASR